MIWWISGTYYRDNRIVLQDASGRLNWIGGGDCTNTLRNWSESGRVVCGNCPTNVRVEVNHVIKLCQALAVLKRFTTMNWISVV